MPLMNDDHQHPQHVVIGVLVFGQLRHVGGHRPHESVAEQNAQKGSDQGRGDLVPDLLRRPAQRSHGDHHAEHGGNDAQSGQGSAMVASAATGSVAS